MLTTMLALELVSPAAACGEKSPCSSTDDSVLELTVGASGKASGTVAWDTQHSTGTVCGLAYEGSATGPVSGWTDHNVHDPGITLLELLWALPEVGDEFCDKENKAAGTRVSLVIEAD